VLVTAERNLSQISRVVSALVYKCLKMQQDCCIVMFRFSDLLFASLPQSPLIHAKSQKKKAKNCCFLANRGSSQNSMWVGIKGFCWLKMTYIFSLHYFLIISMWFQHQFWF